MFDYNYMCADESLAGDDDLKDEILDAGLVDEEEEDDDDDVSSDDDDKISEEDDELDGDYDRDDEETAVGEVIDENEAT